MYNDPYLLVACKCSSKLNEQKEIFKKFIQLSSHTEQNIYLQGCVTLELKTTKYRKSKKKNLFSLRTEEFWCAWLQLQLSIVLNVTGLLPRPSSQRRTSLRSWKTSFSSSSNIQECIHDFVDSFPIRESHYSRSDNHSTGNTCHLNSPMQKSTDGIMRNFLKISSFMKFLEQISMKILSARLENISAILVRNYTLILQQKFCGRMQMK